MRFTTGIMNILSLAPSYSLAKTRKLDSERLQTDIKTSNLVSTLNALNDIAFTNGGNRAFGLPGYQASVDYIYTRISKVRNANIWNQTFPALFTFVDSIELIVDNKSIDVYGLTYSPSTTKAGIKAEIALGPEGTASCDTSSYDDLNVKGKIVLVRNAPCRTSEGLARKVISAAAAGASAVIIYDDPTINIATGSLGRPNPGSYVPAGFISHAAALKIKDRIEAGQTVKAYFQQTQIVEERFTQNIIAETSSGDPSNVIMLGAHLDSVQDGPGINDNGSGSSLILELFLALSNYRTKNRIRFAWWGAEENGLLGSKHYTSTLSANDVEKLLVYLNFDMVSKGFFGVADADGSSYGCEAPKGSEAIEKIFVEYFTSKGIETTPVALTNGSDYAPFWQSLGMPFGFLHTGTAVRQDPCYHKSCDSIENANSKTLTINARAAAHILAVLDDRGTKLIHKAKTTTDILSGL